MEDKLNHFQHQLSNSLTVNNRSFKQINLSNHLEKHIKEGSVNEKQIIELVLLIDKDYFPIDGEDKEGRIYFKAFLFSQSNRKYYKLVWWWWKDYLTEDIFIRTCYPVKKIS